MDVNSELIKKKTNEKLSYDSAPLLKKYAASATSVLLHKQDNHLTGVTFFLAFSIRILSLN